MKVRYSPRATYDLIDIASYLRERTPKGAGQVEAAIKRVIQLIAQQPRLGRINDEGVRQIVVPKNAYLIYYEIHDQTQEIRIITIRHASREPPSFA